MYIYIYIYIHKHICLHKYVLSCLFPFGEDTEEIRPQARSEVSSNIPSDITCLVRLLRVWILEGLTQADS